MSITVTPQSTITLCKTKLENDYKNTINFANLQAQTSYFNSLPNLRDIGNDDYTYVRANKSIQVDIPYDDIIGYNYLFYTNTGFTNKTYYCFITGMKYINENATEIYIETDVLQTWMFDITYHPCYIEREHVSDDTVGKHTVPEGLDTGDYIINAVDYVCYDVNTDIIVAVSDINIQGSDSSYLKYFTNNCFGRVFQGEYYFLFTGNNKYQEAKNFIVMYDLAGKGDAVSSVFMIPGTMTNKLTNKTNYTIPFTNTYTGSSVTVSYYIFSNVGAISIETDKQVSINTTINGYTPKNNKLFVYPYNCLEVTNNNGGDVIYQYEQFINNQPRFNVYGVVTPGCSIRLVPLYYNKLNEHQLPTQDGILYGYNDGLNLGKLPVGSWKSDVYINWLTQNGINQTWGMVKNSINAMGSAAKGDPSGAAGGILGIVDTLVNNEQRQVTPDTAKGNTNNGDVCFATYSTMFQMNKKSIKSEYAQIIDNYFQMFGYKVNVVKTPQFTSRTYWNYIKTIDANMDGNIPQEDIQKIRSVFNNGITFWHNNDTNMYNYSLTNSIVS